MTPNFFEKRDRWGNGLALWVVVGMAFLVPLSVWSLSGITMENEVHNWISKDNPEHQAFEWYKAHFPTDDAILFSWEGSSLTDSRADALVSAIRGTTNEAGQRRGASKYFARVRTPHDLLAQMEKMKIPHDEALARLEGVLIGSGPVRIRLTETGRTRQEKLIELLRKQARDSLNIELQIGGSVAEAASTETEPSAETSSTESAEGETAVAATESAESGESAREARGERPTIATPHDLTVSWRGMHWNPQQIEKFSELARGLRFPLTKGTKAISDKPLVEECFRIPGTPIALALYLSEPGRADRTAAFRWLQQASSEAGIPEQTIHMGGSGVAGEALNREVIKAVWDKSAPANAPHRRSLVLLSGLVGAALSFWTLRSVRLAGLVLGVSYYTALISTALVPITGGSMNMVLVVMPTLLFVTTLSVAIHIANYWQHAAANDMRTAIVEAVKTAYVPCLWAGLTSAVGQASLMTSSLTPVRDFGLYSAIGTLVSLVVTLYGLPALMQILPAKKAPKAEDLDNAFWHALAAWVARHYRGVIITSLLLAAGCTWGLTRFKTETKVIRYFADTTRTVRDYDWLEDNLSGIIPVEVIVRFDRESQQQLKFLQRRDLVQQIEDRIKKVPEISGALSLSDFLPEEPAVPATASKSRLVKYAAASRAIETRVKSGEHTAARTLLAVADDNSDLNAKQDELWRITAQVAIMSQLNYADLRKELDEICMSVLRETSGASVEKVPAGAAGRAFHPGASHVVTGMIPLFLATQQELLDGFVLSFIGAFASIAVMVMFVLRNPIAGLLAMIPNILPIGAVFGLISWSGMRVDMGSTVTASIALGITIDGTLHLITWFRIGIQEGKSRAEAVAQALGHCGPAMWQTTLVVSIGLLMLYPSDLVLISRFGWLMAALLAAASVSDLVLTPALLAGPLGALIRRSTPADATGSSDTSREDAAERAGAIPGKPHLDQRAVRLRRID